MRTVADVVTAARDWHPAFSRAATPDAAAVRYLTGAHRALYLKVASRFRDYLAEPFEVAMPLADFAAGTGLPDHLHLETREAVTAGGAYRLHLIPPGQASGVAWPGVFAAWVGKDGAVSRLYLAGSAASWAMVTRLVLSIVATPGELTRLEDSIELPDEAFDVLVARLVAFMAVRVDVKSGAAYASSAAAIEEAYLYSIAAAMQGQVGQVREG